MPPLSWPPREQRGESGGSAELAQRRLDEAGRAAEQVRAAAESDAAGIVRRAEEAAEQITNACAEAEADLRAAKDEASQLRADLERREVRLAEREAPAGRRAAGAGAAFRHPGPGQAGAGA